ncbi:hypothetical protein [Mycobacterium paraterrae]|uniref:Uncharacterized protein n=1 Tax=Mycobacterium paraterrae TaxID=577492 RepID=A0ABY3VJX8_9MYCO|nr:hypothetical protein [Mycobacterium paraterrae]UMB68951.1 hypothetical protein MKK62_21590 [Mycobacterium paraterrae]
MSVLDARIGGVMAGDDAERSDEEERPKAVMAGDDAERSDEEERPK